MSRRAPSRRRAPCAPRRRSGRGRSRCCAARVRFGSGGSAPAIRGRARRLAFEVGGDEGQPGAAEAARERAGRRRARTEPAAAAARNRRLFTLSLRRGGRRGPRTALVTLCHWTSPALSRRIERAWTSRPGSVVVWARDAHRPGRARPRAWRAAWIGLRSRGALPRSLAAAYRAAYLVTHDAAAAEDIAQESFLAALRALDTFDRRRPFGPWLHRIVVNRAIDWTRARRLRAEVELSESVPAAGASRGRHATTSSPRSPGSRPSTGRWS